MGVREVPAPTIRGGDAGYFVRRRDGVCDKALAAAVFAAGVALRLASVLLAADAALRPVCRGFFAILFTSLRAYLRDGTERWSHAEVQPAHDVHRSVPRRLGPAKAEPSCFSDPSEIRLHHSSTPGQEPSVLVRVATTFILATALFAHIARRADRRAADLLRRASEG